MTQETKPHVFMFECRSCKKQHRMTLQPCPECGVYLTPQPASSNVADHCFEDYACDGCIAYRDHQR